MCFQLCAKGTGYKFRFLNKTMFLVALILIDYTFILEFCASSRSFYTNSKRFSCKPTAGVLSPIGVFPFDLGNHSYDGMYQSKAS